MFRISTQGPVFYQFEQWADSHAPIHGVFTRIGGVSTAPWASLNVGSTVGDDVEAVAQNKAIMVESLGFTVAESCTVWQVHGNETIVVDDAVDLAMYEDGLLGQADGLVTHREEVMLVMRFADCVPILFYDPVQQIIGMAHAGWRGTMIGAGPSVVQKMTAVYGSRPSDIQASIGPSIGPGRYQVGEEVVTAVAEAFATTDGIVRITDHGEYYLNLWEANHRALVQIGVEQIEVAALCTASHTDEFYSHRAEHGATGRFGAALALPRR